MHGGVIATSKKKRSGDWTSTVELLMLVLSLTQGGDRC